MAFTSSPLGGRRECMDSDTCRKLRDSAQTIVMGVRDDPVLKSQPMVRQGRASTEEVHDGSQDSHQERAAGILGTV